MVRILIIYSIPLKIKIILSFSDKSFFISDTSLFCGRGHNLIGKWAHGESRGGRTYNPPDGWIGFGLNVINKYDNRNNDWLACDGRPGEWCVAFHLLLEIQVIK